MATKAKVEVVNKNLSIPVPWLEALQAAADQRGWSLTRLLLQGGGHFLSASTVDALPSLEDRKRGRPATKTPD